MKLDNIELEKSEDKKVKETVRIDRDRLFLIESIAGIIVLIALIIIACLLLFKKEPKTAEENVTTVEKEAEVEENVNIEPVEENSEDIISDTEDAVNVNKAEVATTDLTELSRPATVKGELSQTFEVGNMLNYTKDSYQLPELYSYWDNYQLDAVADLIRLDRVRTITNSLGTSKDFYYYGSTGGNGKPDGKGLAVYANNTYYFGEWSDGKRSGEGMWIRLFIDKTGIVNGVKGVKEHQYNGNWSDDLPNGPGQEHIDYDTSMIDKEFTITNAIGEFKDGYYQGDMYIMTINSSGNTTDWYGTCEKGSFKFLSEKKTSLGKRSIWKAGDGYSTGEEDDCRWIMPKDNMNFGISGLKR